MSNSIFLFFGADNYTSFQTLKVWKHKFIEKYGEDSDIEVLDNFKKDMSSILTNLETLPFLTEKKMVIFQDFLKNADKESQEKMANHLGKIPDTTVCIFFENSPPDKRTMLFKRLKKEANLQEFPVKDPHQVATWIKDRAKKYNASLSPKTANDFVNYCGTDLWKISNELQKLIIYADGKEITTEMITNFSTPTITASIFDLTDGISNKKPQVALKVFNRLLDSGESPIKILFTIVAHFRTLIQVYDLMQRGMPQNEIQSTLKKHPFVIKKTAQQSRNFDFEKLKKIYKELLNIDHDFKTGKIKIIKEDHKEYALAIEKFIINCCK